MMAGNMRTWDVPLQAKSGGSSSRRNTPLSNFSDSRRSLASEGGYQDDDTLSQYSDVSAYDKNCSEVYRRICSLFMQQLYTDVKFVINCGTKHKPTLQAHKAILAVGCDKFREILFDTSSDRGPSEIQINNIPYDAFRNVVEYLYTNEVFFENELSAMETLSAALKFKIQSLVDKCESYLKTSELTANNVCTKFQLATDHRITELKNRCAEFIQENTAAVLTSPSFTMVSMSTVRSICKMEKLNLRSETELLKGVLRWTEAQPDSKRNKRILIEPFLKHIRFLTLSSNEFNRFVQDYPTIFTAPEATNILTFLTNPSYSSSLPTWCNKGSNRCTAYLVPPKPRKSIYPVDEYFHIPLKSCKGNQFLTDLKCIIKLHGTRGNHKIKAIKIIFGDPVYESSLINLLLINILSESTGFSLEERVKIANSKSVIVRFSKVVSINPGQTVSITVEANGVRDYKFLQFDDSQSFGADSPFTCSLASNPQQGRFFFISQVIYRKAFRRVPQKQYYTK